MIDRRTILKVGSVGMTKLMGATAISVVRMRVFAAGKDGGPHVKVFSSAGAEQASFYAYDPNSPGQVVEVRFEIRHRRHDYLSTTG